MKVLSSPAFAMQPPTRPMAAATPARATATPPTPASSARSGWLLHNGIKVDTVEGFMEKLPRTYEFMIGRIEQKAVDLLEHTTEHLQLNQKTLEWIRHGNRQPKQVVTEETLNVWKGFVKERANYASSN
jgi:hypothetical protein